MPNTVALARFLRGRMSQRELGRITGISDARIWQIENEYRHPPSPTEREKIAKALETDVDKLWPSIGDVEGVPV